MPWPPGPSSLFPRSSPRVVSSLTSDSVGTSISGSQSLPGHLSVSPWFFPSSISPSSTPLQLAAAIPTLPRHHTLTCIVSDPGNGLLPPAPRGRCWQQQQEQLEEEQAYEAPWVQAQGWKGHAQPGAVTRWLWGNRHRGTLWVSSPHHNPSSATPLPRPHLDQSGSPRSRSV